MVIESFNVREKKVPSSCIEQIKLKKYRVEQNIDSDGVSHSVLVENVQDDFLDVPFREFSMNTYVATGEVTRLHLVSPIHERTLDVYDRVTGDLEEISARIDHMELMDRVSQSAKASEVISEQ